MLSQADVSRRFWSAYQVEPHHADLASSRAAIAKRHELYPDMAALMPTDLPGKVILDYGCGPGSDVIQFLEAGAALVYAADVSPLAIARTRWRLGLHGLDKHCILIPLHERNRLPTVDYIHCSGVLHHCADPVGVLREMRAALRPWGEIRLMVYSASSALYRISPETFGGRVDAGAPICHAWATEEVGAMAIEAGLLSTYLGSYRHPGDPEGNPGLSACYSLIPC